MKLINEYSNTRFVHHVARLALVGMACLVSASAMAGKPTTTSGGSDPIPFMLQYECSSDLGVYVLFDLLSEDIPDGKGFAIEYIMGSLRATGTIGSPYIIFYDMDGAMSPSIGAVPSAPGYSSENASVSSMVSLYSETTPRLRAMGFQSSMSAGSSCQITLHGHLVDY